MHKTKNKWYTRAIYLGVVLAMTVGLLMVPAAGADPGEICGCLGSDPAGSTAEWSSTSPQIGTYSAKLTQAAAAGSVYVQFTPAAGITVADLDDIAASPEWSFYHNTPAALANWAQLELRFTAATCTDPDGAGHVDVTLMPLQNHTGSGTWAKFTVLASSSPANYYGNDPTDGTGFGTGVTMALSAVEAAINAEGAMTAGGDSASDWELTRVRMELWEAGARTCGIDEVTIDGTTYDLEPCYYLEPDIAKNVKTADATFTVVDGCGNAIGATTRVQNWIVTKGEGAGVVTIVAGGVAGDDYITVRMVTTGDCIITCDVEYDWAVEEGFVKDITLHAEKKWGEIYYTELTAWSDTPCEQRPDFVGDTEISRVIDLGGAASVDALVQEAVIAEFLPGPVPAYAGGAKITWWLLENDEDGYAQADLEELVGLFDSYDYVSGELGYGHGCGQYAEWAIANPDPDFIPEDLIDAIYALYPAVDTLFTEAECVDITDTTKTVTETDHVLEPLGEGFTNVLVEFSDVGTGLAEPVIVVVLADYPLDKNGENAVCVEYFKFKSTIVVIPEVCQVKVPQVRWAGEKIVLEKDWETEPDQLVGFFLEESCVGNMIPFPGDEGDTTGYIISEDARTAFTVTDAAGVARAMFESEQQGQVDVKCVLYGTSMNVSSMAFGEVMSVVLDGGVVGNHGFLVYYLALENVTVDEELSDLVGNESDEDADVLVKVRGWFTSDTLPGTSRGPVDANGDLVYELPAGRYVLPDDWSALAGSDEATSNMASRPQYDLMNTPGDGVVSTAELGPYDSGVRTTTPPGEADNPVIGPFNTLQPWNCVDELGDPTNMWIAEAVVPADYTVAVPITGLRNAADLRNTVVPDTTIDEFDCPMPQALVTFDVDDTEVLSALDKGTVLGYGIDAADKFIAPFYAMEIPSHWLIPSFGYFWDSWGLWTGALTDDGPYDFWTDLGITPSADDILEVYSDNHGYAGVTIDALEEEGTVMVDVIADFPVMACKYPAVVTATSVTWGPPISPELNPWFLADNLAPDVDETVTFTNLTVGGTLPYVAAEWDFDDDGVVDSIAAVNNGDTVTWQYDAAGTYDVSLKITDTAAITRKETRYDYIVVAGGGTAYAACDIDESGTVNIADFVLFAASYGLSLGDVGYDGRCDLDASDGVGILDFVIFAQCWAVEA